MHPSTHQQQPQQHHQQLQQQQTHAHQSHQQQHHHSHPPAQLNQQQHQMHHSQQGPPPSAQPQHHQPQIPHHHTQHHHHPHNHHHHNPQHPHLHHQHQHPSHQQQSAAPGPPQQQPQLQHSQQPLPIPGSMHPASQAQGPPHPIAHGAHPQQHQPHHVHPQGAQLPHTHPTHGQQPQSHSGRHSQAQPTTIHAPGAVQQRHPHPHVHPHQQHAHHQQPHQMPPNAHQMAHPMMMSHQYQNMVYVGAPQAYPGAHPPQAFNHQSPVAAGLRADGAGGLNSQQPPTSINPANMPPMNHIANAPVISTSATGTANVHHQANNGPVMDPSLQPRIPINHQAAYMMPGGYPYNHMLMHLHAHMQSPYQTPMQASPMVQQRIPNDMTHIRQPYIDPQNHNLANKVPIPAPIINAKPPVPTGPAVGISPTSISTTPTIQKRERRPALIKDPSTGQEVKLDLSTKKQDAVLTKTTESPTSTTTNIASTDIQATTVQANPAPDTTVTTPVTVNNANDSLDLKMKNLNLEDPASLDSSKQLQSGDTTSSSQASSHVISSVQESPKRGLPHDIRPSSTSTLVKQTESLNVVYDQAASSSSFDSKLTRDQDEQRHDSSPTTSQAEPELKQEAEEPAKLPTSNSFDEPDRAISSKTKPVTESNNTVMLTESDEKNSIFNTLEDTGKSTVDELKANKKPEKEPLNLPYAAGQYSPLNPNGRRKYSRDFLIAVRDMMKPELDHILLSLNGQNRVDIMAPSYINVLSFSSNYRDPASSRRSNQQTAVRLKRVIPTSLQPEIELKTTENAWKPELETEKSKAVETGEMDTTRLLKVFRGHLNKLTPQKYDSIIEKVASLDLGGSERLTAVIDLVFDKAVDEPGFCELYANMCKVIATKHKDFFFHLVKKCQEEFETSDLYDGLNVESRKEDIEKESDPQRKKQLSDELYEDMRLRRKKYLGTIKLIGEMYKLNLLIPKIIGLCMKHLIDGASNENLECLCSLLATVGAKMASEEDEHIRQSLAHTLKTLYEFAHSKKVEDSFALESRIKFKILDTIDLSRKNWRPRMVENNPKKIEEIREEKIKEDKLRQQQNHMSQSRNLLKSDERDRHRRQGGNNSYPKSQNPKWS